MSIETRGADNVWPKFAPAECIDSTWPVVQGQCVSGANETRWWWAVGREFPGAANYNGSIPATTLDAMSVHGEIVRFVIVLLAVCGMIVSILALKVHFDDPGKEPCSINDKWDCGVVNHSPYAMIAGIPVAAIGIAGYLLIAVLAFLRRRLLLLLSVLIALAFALYLTNIEAHILEVWCLYCVISQGIIAIIALLSVVWAGLARRRPAAA